MAKKRGIVELKTKRELHQIAHYVFFVGLMLAIVAGLLESVLRATIANYPVVIVTTLVLLGFIVGLFNLTTKETIPFLVAAIALMLAGIVNLGIIPYIGLPLRGMLSNIVVFVVPGAILVGLKTIWKLASS